MARSTHHQFRRLINYTASSTHDVCYYPNSQASSSLVVVQRVHYPLPSSNQLHAEALTLLHSVLGMAIHQELDLPLPVGLTTCMHAAVHNQPISLCSSMYAYVLQCMLCTVVFWLGSFLLRQLDRYYRSKSSSVL